MSSSSPPAFVKVVGDWLNLTQWYIVSAFHEWRSGVPYSLQLLNDQVSRNKAFYCVSLLVVNVLLSETTKEIIKSC